jgi:hypothetical protein
MKAITNKQYILNSLQEAINDLEKLIKFHEQGIILNKKQRWLRGIYSFSSKDPLCPTIDSLKRCQIGPNKCFFYSGEFGCQASHLFFLTKADLLSKSSLKRRHILLSRLYTTVLQDYTDRIGLASEREKLRNIVNHIETNLNSYYKSKN